MRVRAAFQGTATRSAATSVPVVVGQAGEATEGTDYETVNDFSVSIPAYASSGTGTFTLKTAGAPYNDSDFEGPETLTVAGGTLAGFTINEDTLTIVDDDGTVTLSVSPG